MSQNISTLINSAIQSATTGNWQQAVHLNNTILEKNPQDIATLNRLGRAYTALGNILEAINAYKQVLAIDPYNSIANKNASKLQQLQTTGQTIAQGAIAIDPSRFIKEPGTAKVVTLAKIAAPQICLSLISGETVELRTLNRFITVIDCKKRSLGKIPEDISYKLVKLIKQGYSYTAYIKSTQPKEIQILIREAARPQHLREYPSFCQSNHF